MYCRECGEKLTLRFCENEGLIPYCAKCSAYMFPQFSVAVSMVVTNRAQNKILLAKHVDDDDFILFAGYVKKGENAEKTVPREIKEELGLDVVKTKYMSSRYHSQKELLLLNFIVIVEEKPLKIKEDEIAEARWCTPEEAVALIRKGTTAEYFLNNAVRELKKKI
ncbi:MAG: NUDIX domain-containing protein [Clostridia bacterium]|nr:NUDIX domain-containing protein [Clostridia bacterium]